MRYFPGHGRAKSGFYRSENGRLVFKPAIYIDLTIERPMPFIVVALVGTPRYSYGSDG